MARPSAKIADRQTRALRAAILESMQRIREGVVLSDVLEQIQLGNVDQAIELLGINRQAMASIEREVEEAYRIGGAWTAEALGPVPQLGGGRALVQFDQRSARAERWARDMAGRLITETVNEQRDVVRRVIQEQLADGENPRRVLQRIVGLPQGRGKPRAGGVIGLTSNQQKWVANAERELREMNPRYFSRELRNKRLDARIKKAFADGKPPAEADIRRAVGKLEENALKYRAEVISRTESLNALRAGQDESIQQAMRAAGADPQDVTKTWDASGDGRVRDSHSAMDGQTVAINQPFRFPGGGAAMLPGDQSLGAPASETIQCRCRADYNVDFIGRQARIEGFK